MTNIQRVNLIFNPSVHRFLVTDRGILHRDPSANNVLCYPIFGEQQVSDEGRRPRFIEELLSYQIPSEER